MSNLTPKFSNNLKPKRKMMLREHKAASLLKVESQHSWLLPAQGVRQMLEPTKLEGSDLQYSVTGFMVVRALRVWGLGLRFKIPVTWNANGAHGKFAPAPHSCVARV